MEGLKLFLRSTDASLKGTSEQINKGDNILVTGGPLKNVRGEVVAISGRRRILLRFINMGYCVHVKPGAGGLERIKTIAPSHMNA